LIGRRKRAEAIRRQAFNVYFGKMEISMAAIAQRLFSQALATQNEFELLPVLIFCGAGLAVSLLFATYGLDLSPGFF
jgi:hypothetical protein